MHIQSISSNGQEMEHRDLKTFTVVARTLSFNKAALMLHTAPVAVQDEVARRAIAPLSWSGDPLASGILMIWHKEKWISPVLKTFMKLMRETMTGQGLRT
jgi:DNA-binding transcriptional LysR family regulator